mmetsp:Transcript_12757/g.19399  ORF Transcript_12757/g.19399 Transcript_12757/m.19399 type:complete len:158 (+) Transcript_12757:174-647(+)
MKTGIIATIVTFFSFFATCCSADGHISTTTSPLTCVSPIDLLTARVDALEEHSKKTCIGSTSSADWVDFKGQGASVAIDTAHCGFAATDKVLYFTSIRGDSHHWTAQGVAGIYEQTYNSFTVYVYSTQGIHDSLYYATHFNWEIQYIAMIDDSMSGP